jgi:GNAT superfamily N-acetyltransferase
MSPSITIAQATTPDDLDAVRDLMRGFIAWHRIRHRPDAAMIDRYFDPVAFEEELDALPGGFAPPAGSLLLARASEEPAGCVALRDLGHGACEMKRMFVHERFHGLGIGRALAQAIVADARALGYSIMRLDTGSRQVEAQTLYQQLGFRKIEPYYDLPDDLRAWLHFMELDLRTCG